MHISRDQDKPFTSISVGNRGQVWGVATDGSAWFRTGVSPENPAGNQPSSILKNFMDFVVSRDFCLTLIFREEYWGFCTMIFNFFSLILIQFKKYFVKATSFLSARLIYADTHILQLSFVKYENINF